jgi:ADP-ribose pyrophosphatase
MSLPPKVVSKTELSATEAKWITLKKIDYSDAEGHKRVWECAERKTPRSSGIDAVAVLAVIQSKTNAFPISTVVIEQYRPPIDKFVIELPAGLIDEGETPEQAAVREFQEETGFKADRVIETSPLIVSDPGMTNANMKLVVLSVVLDDKVDLPSQQLAPGEFIVRRVVGLANLNHELTVYAEKGFVIDARLFHFASGYEMAGKYQIQADGFPGA